MLPLEGILVEAAVERLVTTQGPAIRVLVQPGQVRTLGVPVHGLVLIITHMVIPTTVLAVEAAVKVLLEPLRRAPLLEGLAVVDRRTQLQVVQ